MNFMQRINKARAERKSFTEPPFWALPDMWAPPSMVGNKEKIENDFEGYVSSAYKKNGTVFACMAARQYAFSEVRFQWTRFVGGGPGELFGTVDLVPLEKPWPGGTTGELLIRMIQDADLAGNFYATMVDDDANYGNAATGPGRRITRLRPDWVSIILGSKSGDLRAADTKIITYRYEPPGDAPVVQLLPEEVCHFSPNPDPAARFRGMSWLTPVLREIEADSLATLHKKKFLENSAVPNMAVKFDKEISEDEFDAFVEKFKETHQGAMNAYKTLFLMGGADVTPLSHDFRQLEFNQSVGKGEDRIASAAGVPGQWVGFTGAMSGSGLNSQGVYSAARRRFADVTIRPMWRMAAASLQVLLNVPPGAELWFDDRHVAFLREDTKDRAEIFMTTMSAIGQGILSGFEPDAMITAARDYDENKLIGKHTGLTSVQMQEPHSAQTQALQDAANLTAVQAATVVELISTGAFTEESIIAAAQGGDISLLKKAPKPVVAPPGAGPPGVQPPGQPPGTVPPTQPAPNPNDVPGGGSNGA